MGIKLNLHKIKMSNKVIKTEFYKQIIHLLHSARNKVVQTVNSTMVTVYYEIGRMIVEQEQQGNDRAEYGKQLLKELSGILTEEFGKGFSVTNIQQMRNFYLAYRKQQTLSVKSDKGKIELRFH